MKYLLSSKPLLITARDGLLLSIVAVIVYVIILIFYYYAFDAPIFTRENMVGAAESFALSIMCQLIYEYSSLNAMVAESSLRYAKGSTLQKYTSRRHAMLNELYYKLGASATPDVKTALKKNMIVLSLLVSQPGTLYKINNMAAEMGAELDASVLLTKINATNTHITRAELDAVLEIDTAILREMPAVLDDMDEDIIEDILMNGFDGYDAPNKQKSAYKWVKSNIQDFGEIRLSNRIKDKIRAVREAKLARLESEASDAPDEDIVLNYGSSEELANKIASLKKKLRK